VISARLVGDRELAARLEAVPEAAAAGLGRALLRLAQELQDRARDKVSGEVLQSRSGALRSSITAETSGLTVTVGSDLAYAAAQEYGFTGTVAVRPQLRRIKEVFGRPIAEKTIAVGGYSRRINLPARSFLGSALAELQPAIEQAVREALAEAIAR
jgi:phage gpG-like protein